jgi:protoporphyrinogen oxidase
MAPQLCGTLADPDEASRALWLRRVRRDAVGRPGLPRATLGDVAEAAASRAGAAYLAEVRRVEAAANGARVVWTAQGRERSVEARAVVVATPAPEAARIASGLLLAAERDALERVRYASSLAVAVALRRPLGPHAELVRFPRGEDSTLESALLEPGAGGGRAPDGRGLAVLRASAGFAASVEELPDDTVEKELVGAFEEVRPGLRSAALFSRVLRLRQALPRFDVGHYRAVARLEELGARLRSWGRRLYLAGDYLVDPSWSGAVAAGERAARAAAADLA